MIKYLLKYGVGKLTFKTCELYLALATCVCSTFIKRGFYDSITDYTISASIGLLAILIAVFTFLYSRINPTFIKWFEEKYDGNINVTLSPIYFYAILLSLAFIIGIVFLCVKSSGLFYIHVFLFSWGFWGHLTLYSWASRIIELYNNYINYEEATREEGDKERE